MSAVSGLPSIDPEVNDTVDENENSLETAEISHTLSSGERSHLISVKQCVRKVTPYLTG